MRASPGFQPWTATPPKLVRFKAARKIRLAGVLFVCFYGTFSAFAEQNGGKLGLRAGNVPDEPVAISPSVGGKEQPAVTAIEVGKAGGRTQVKLRLSAPVDASAFLLADPDRAVIDLPEVKFSLGSGAGLLPGAGKKAGLAISGYRFGLLEAGKSRVVIDILTPVRISAARPESRNGAHSFVLEFEPVSRSDFLAAAKETAVSPAAGASRPKAASLPVENGQPVIVLDPGHGGIDTGARGALQASEKEVVLAFAHALGEKLEESGRYKVVFTRADDVFVSLPERVKIAREAGAKLFISIHADTLNERWVEGATVYTVSDRASDIHAARLAEKENLADKMAGVEGVEDVGDVSDILFDLTRRETRTLSHYFARSLVAYWKDAGKLNKNPIRSAGFRVLMAPDVPSVLLELGYLSSKAEAAKLAQPEWRAKAAASVALSVDSFFALQAAPVEGLAPEGRAVPKEAEAGPQSGVAAAIR